MERKILIDFIGRNREVVKGVQAGGPIGMFAALIDWTFFELLTCARLICEARGIEMPISQAVLNDYISVEVTLQGRQSREIKIVGKEVHVTRQGPGAGKYSRK